MTSRLAWKSARLDQVARLIGGTTPSRRSPEFFAGGSIPWVKTGDLNNGLLVSTEEQVTPRAAIETGLVTHPAGTVLVSMYGGFRQIGRTGVLGVPATTNQAITAIYCSPSTLLPEFLLHVLNSKVRYWRALAGSSRKDPNITRADVAGFPLLLPGLETQAEIVARLRPLVDHLELITRVISTKLVLRRGLMQQLLAGLRRFPGFTPHPHPHSRETEVGILPSDWELDDLGAVVEGVTRRVGSEEVPVLTCSGRLGLVDHRRYFSKRVASESREEYYLLRRGEFAYNRSTMKGYPFGAVKRLEGLDAGALSTLNICFRAIPTRWNSRYASHLFESGLLNPQLGRLTQVGARAHGLLNISKSDFFRLRVSVPAMAEQERIADLLDLLDREVTLLERLRDAYDLRRQSVTEKLLSGEALLPDSTEVTAS